MEFIVSNLENLNIQPIVGILSIVEVVKAYENPESLKILQYLINKKVMCTCENESVVDLLNSYFESNEMLHNHDVRLDLSQSRDKTGEETKHKMIMEESFELSSDNESSPEITYNKNLVRNKNQIRPMEKINKESSLVDKVVGNINNMRVLKIKYMLADRDISTSLLRFATDPNHKYSSKYLQEKDIVEIALSLSMMKR